MAASTAPTTTNNRTINIGDLNAARQRRALLGAGVCSTHLSGYGANESGAIRGQVHVLANVDAAAGGLIEGTVPPSMLAAPVALILSDCPAALALTR